MSMRIVVTGIGLVTPIGSGNQGVWEGFLSGRSGFAPVQSFDSSAFNVHVGAEVRDFQPEAHVRRQDPSRLGRASQFAIAAARMALADAGCAGFGGFGPFDLDEKAPPDPAGAAGVSRSVSSSRAGVAMGTTSGEPREVERFDDQFLAGRLDAVGPELISRYPCHLIAAHV
ncbi:MAG TPA: beta-ketoacyl synthase N-terminal-like domain-containing protein, partial [Thermoanaerobaculia bacterium]|nr:beta-ketoacyl synthase N-terminal-like domain-containing protein [Thermoanaerobaculia bacterium]